MFKKAIQKLHEELDILTKNQHEHMRYLMLQIEKQKQKMESIERTVIGHPDDAHHCISGYPDKHGF